MPPHECRRLLGKRRPWERGLAKHGYKSIRCAVCHRRFWPWQRRIQGANYFPHPYMECHLECGYRLEAEMTGRPSRSLKA